MSNHVQTFWHYQKSETIPTPFKKLTIVGEANGWIVGARVGDMGGWIVGLCKVQRIDWPIIHAYSSTDILSSKHLH